MRIQLKCHFSLRNLFSDSFRSDAQEFQSVLVSITHQLIQLLIAYDRAAHCTYHSVLITDNLSPLENASIVEGQEKKRSR